MAILHIHGNFINWRGQFRTFIILYSSISRYQFNGKICFIVVLRPDPEASEGRITNTIAKSASSNLATNLIVPTFYSNKSLTSLPPPQPTTVKSLTNFFLVLTTDGKVINWIWEKMSSEHLHSSTSDLAAIHSQIPITRGCNSSNNYFWPKKSLHV